MSGVDVKPVGQQPATRNTLSFSRAADDTLVVRLAGHWRLQDGIPTPAEVQKQLDTAPPRVQRLAFDTVNLSAWDSGLLTFLIQISRECARREIAVDPAGLPDGVRRLLNLAAAVPPKEGTGKEAVRQSFVSRVGTAAIDFLASSAEMLSFLGEATLAFVRLLRGKARFRRSDLALILQECGAEAFPIVTLISFLVGTILAFLGAVQLEQFGAQIYVANMVAVAMAVEMGAMMTAIIMAGRTGAAFAAQLGTMTVNEEIDALKTMAISPMEFLVLPRMLALILMMPLLTLYADLMGIIGGAFIGATMLDLSFTAYFDQTRNGVQLHHFAEGLVKSAVYGVLVASAGCLRGMQCGRSASAVGAAATSAVVTGILAIIIASSILTVIYQVLKI